MLFLRALLMAVALVGSTAGTHLATSAGSIATTRNGIIAGSTIVCAVTVEDLVTITNVSDGTTTKTVPDIAVDWTAGTQRLALYSFPNHPGGNFTFTATFSGSQTFRGLDIAELTPSVFDAASSGTGTSAAPSSGNITPSVDGSYFLGFALGASALTKAAAFTDLVNDPTTLTSDFEGFAQSTKAALAATWTMTSGIWGAIGASYRPPFIPGGLARSQQWQSLIAQ